MGTKMAPARFVPYGKKSFDLPGHLCKAHTSMVNCMTSHHDSVTHVMHLNASANLNELRDTIQTL